MHNHCIIAAGVIPTSLAPSGNAVGLAGTYPNPTMQQDLLNNCKIADAYK
jgi:hypothetical protein